MIVVKSSVVVIEIEMHNKLLWAVNQKWVVNIFRRSLENFNIN